MTRNSFAILFSILFSSVFSQTKEIDSLKTLINSTDDTFTIAKSNLTIAKLHERIDLNKGKTYALQAYTYKKNDSLLAETNNQLGRLYFFTNQLDSATIFFKDARALLKKQKDKKQSSIINISLGAIYLRQGNYEKTIATLTESASFFEANEDELNAAKCYSNISSAFAELENYDKAIEYSEKALEVFNKNSLSQFQLITLPNLATQHYKKGDTIKAINYYNEAETLAKKLKNKRSLSMIYNNLGNIYLENNPNKAESYLLNALQLKEELNLNDGIDITKSNLGYIYLKNKKFSKAISFLKDAENGVRGKQLGDIYTYLSESHKGLNNYAEALEYLNKAKQLNDSLLSSENQKTILDIQTKYETEKKEKEILQLQTDNLITESKRKKNKNLFIIALSLLGLLSFVIYQQSKNAKRKRIILEQEHTIKSQVLEQKLHEQELEGIDAILEAQEQERSKMAEDLHDNLGSKVATLKLYLESYDDKEDFTGFYDKLKKLMNDTYNEIRNISKNKNFGAQINKGLIPSTKTIAKQISDSKTIDIKVINVDVNKRIENTLEIQIFRIIQELLTNIIKHAEATETIIQFSEHDNILNIIVEDNGKGFDTKAKKPGIGLINIEKRIEKIEGELVIDSSIGNGTTVILNIPL